MGHRLYISRTEGGKYHGMFVVECSDEQEGREAVAAYHNDNNQPEVILWADYECLGGKEIDSVPEGALLIDSAGRENAAPWDDGTRHDEEGDES